MNGDLENRVNLDQRIEQLTLALNRSEQRMQRTEQRLRVLGLVLITAVAIWFFVGINGTQAVYAEGVVQRIEHKAEGDLAALEHKGEQEFRALMGRVKRDIAAAEHADPAHMVAVILHDMKNMLEAVPRMADDVNRMANDMQQMNGKMNAVPAMAGEMQQMNVKMGVMAHGVDTTMGRMGRWMPWGP